MRKYQALKLPIRCTAGNRLSVVMKAEMTNFILHNMEYIYVCSMSNRAHKYVIYARGTRENEHAYKALRQETRPCVLCVCACLCVSVSLSVSVPVCVSVGLYLYLCLCPCLCDACVRVCDNARSQSRHERDAHWGTLTTADPPSPDNGCVCLSACV